MKEMDTSVKEMLISDRKHTGNLEHYRKRKSKNCRNKGNRRNSNQRHREYLKQNHRRVFLYPKKGDTEKGKRYMQNTK